MEFIAYVENKLQSFVTGVKMVIFRYNVAALSNLILSHRKKLKTHTHALSGQCQVIEDELFICLPQSMAVLVRAVIVAGETDTQLSAQQGEFYS